MTMRPIPIVDGSYADDSRSFAAQDTVNWLPVSAEQAGARSNTMLRTPPGLREFTQLASGPIRGMRNVEGRLFVVSDESLYSVASTGVATNLGTVPGRSRVSMTHNQITGGNEVVVVNGSAGYTYNTVTSTFAQIIDEGFPGAIVCDYINSLGVFVEPGRRFFFNSDLADMRAYNTIERYESEASPDRLRSLLVSHLELWLFNERTIEVFDNTSDPASIADHILFTNKRIVIERGCAGPHTVCKLDNSVFWAGDDGVIYRADGYTPIRISTQAIERALADCDLSKAWMFTWADRGHNVVYLTCPDGKTWGYDVSSRKWHRRASFGMERWRVNALVQWQSDWYAGDKDGMIYTLDWDYYMESCDPMVSSRTSGVLHDNQNSVTVHALEFKFDTGSDETVCYEAPAYSPATPRFLASGISGKVSGSPTGEAWSDYTSGLSGVTITQMASNGSTVVGSAGGGFYYSTDSGETWTASVSTTTRNITSIAYGNGVFVAGSDTNTGFGYVRSTDQGVTWTEVGANQLSTWIEFGAGVFVSASSAGGLSWSADGATWSAQTGGSYYSVCYNGSLFMAVGSAVYTSPDGAAWTARTALPSTGICVVGGTGYFLASTNASGVYRSTDNGVSWTFKTGGTTMAYAIAYGQTAMFTKDTGELYLTLDGGATWTNDALYSATDLAVCFI